MPRFDAPLITNDQSIDRVLQNKLPVALVMTEGTNLNPSLEESLRQVARDDAGRLLVVKINARQNPQTAARLNGSSLPALITFRDGQEVSRTHDVTSATFRAHVSYLLGRGPLPQETPDQEPQQGVSDKPVIVSDATFQSEVLESDLPVLVDLWAPWCSPCRMIAPVVEKLAGEYAGRLKVTKLNVDDNPQTAMSYQVQGIPTLLMFQGGKMIDRIVGAAPEPMLRGRVEAALRS